MGVGGVGYGVVGEGSGLDGRVRRVDGWGIGGLRWWGKLGVGGEGNGVVGEGGGLREGSGGGWLGVWGVGFGLGEVGGLGLRLGGLGLGDTWAPVYG